MANIEKRNGTYRVKVRIIGHPIQSATFQTRTAAKRWAHSIESAIREGRYFPTSEAKRHTLADLIDRYVRDVLPHKSRSSIAMQTQQLEYWRLYLGEYRLADITPGVIAEHRDFLARTRKNSTVRRYLAALSHACTIAVREYQWLQENPCHKVRKPSEPRGRVRYLSDQERHQLLAACQASRNPYLHTVVLLALATGARRGELLGLCWPDVDLKRGMLIFHETKNGERRAVPLTGHALTLMRQHATIRRLDTALVFPGPTGRRPLSVRNAFENAVEQAGILDFRFHDLRHTAASYLAMNSASLLDISAILGHKSLQMTKRYAHLTEGHARSVVERMNRAMFGEL